MAVRDMGPSSCCEVLGCWRCLPPTEVTCYQLVCILLEAQMILGLSRENLLAHITERPRGSSRLRPAVGSSSFRGLVHLLLWGVGDGEGSSGHSQDLESHGWIDPWHHIHSQCDPCTGLNPSVASVGRGRVSLV